MAKFLYVNDLHCRGRNSINRLGDYYTDWLTKFQELTNVNQDYDFVICGGDLFDSPIVSNNMVDDILDRIETSKKIWYIVAGNHDLIGANVQNSSATSLFHMIRRSKYIKLLDELLIDSTYIKGYSYYYGIEDDIKNHGLKHIQTNKKTIAVPHAFITIKKFHPQVNHVLAKDIDTNFDLILCSHFHEDWSIKKVNNTSFVNVGAFGRLSITEYKHSPQFVIIDTNSLSIEIQKVNNAKQGKDIFNLDKLGEAKAYNENMESFIKSLESVNFQGMSIQGMIKQLQSEQNIDEKVIQLINQMIERTKNETD